MTFHPPNPEDVLMRRLKQVPAVTTPRLEDVADHAQRGLRKTRSLRIMTACLLLGAGVGGLSEALTATVSKIAQDQTQSGEPKNAARQTEGDFRDGLLPSSPAFSTAVSHTPISDVGEIGPDPGFQVLAKIRTECPVFRRDQESGRMIPVGWIRSSAAVPVATHSLTTEQLHAFRSMLDSPSSTEML